MSALEFLLLAPVTLFLIVSPIATVPTFLAMTPGNTRQERSRMARTACIAAGGILLFASLFGAQAMKALGISFPAFQVAGGLLLFFIAFDMLQAKDSIKVITREESQEGAEKDDIAITPLAIPLLSGPGAISATILLTNRAEGLLQHAILYGSIAAVMIATFFILHLSSVGARWLSPLLLKVTKRLMGLLLAAMAVQFVINGLTVLGIIAAS